jgi:hypothetical protein
MSLQPADTTADSRGEAATGDPPGAPTPAARAVTEALPARRRVGRYELRGQLGVGGMGVVFAAHDGVLDREVAIKLVRADRADAAAQARILREARALARLAHPNVVAVHEVSTHEGQLFLVMELVKGTTLRAVVAEGRPLPVLLDMFLQAGRGLAAAHAQGLVHRDFKPDNVLVGADGRARVVDFGLVADPSLPDADDAPADPRRAPEARLTFTGARAGTPAYMAPEQSLGRGADARSDQYSFCVALWEAVCGERPPPGAPRPARAAPEWLLAALRRGLSPRPQDRWPDMAALLELLARDPAAARRRRLRLAALLLAVAVGVAGLSLGAQALRQRWAAARREAEAAAQLAAVQARISAARARGDADAAARSFDDFVADPRFRESAALAQAWLDEAARRREDGQADGATAALARAFVHARAPAPALAALDGLAEVFRAQRRWDALAEVLATRARVDPAAADRPERRALAVESALGRRDVAAARALLPDDAPHALRGLLDRLARATPTDHADVEVHLGVEGPVDLDRDGARELLLFRHGAGGPAVDVVRADASLTRVAGWSAADFAPRRPTRIAALTPADGALRLVASAEDAAGPTLTLARASPSGALQVTHAWPESYTRAAAAADLDGDGVDELYLGTSLGSRRIVELAPDPDGGLTPRPAVAPGDEPASDIEDLEAADLDGDGRPELIVATGPWQSYDVRVYRRGADARLHLVDRDMLGQVFALATLRRGDERLIAASHGRAFPSRVMFPPARPYGEPPGVYLLRLRDDRLERVARLPLPETSPTDHVLASLARPADLDGDGRDDLALNLIRGPTFDAALFLQQPDGGFTRAVLGGTGFLGALELDGDPDPESLLVLDPSPTHGRLWIAGVGAAPLPAAPPGEPVPGDISADAWSRAASPGEPVPEDMSADADAWSRAASLRSMGLHADAAEAFAALARDGGSAAVRGGARLAAARAYELAGEPRRAAEAFTAAAALPGHAEAGARGAYRAHLRLGEYAAAAAALERLLARPGLPDRAELARARERLRPVAEDRARVVWRFADPLAPAVRIADPLALRRDPAAGTLTIDTAAAGPLLSLPVEVVSEILELEAEVTLAAMEWSATLAIELVPEPTGAPALALSATASGGGRTTHRLWFCGFAGRAAFAGQTRRAPETTAPARFTLRASRIPTLGEHACALARDDAPPAVVRDELPPAPLPPGRYRLLVRAATSDGPAHLRAELHRVTLTGAVPAPADDPDDPEQRLAHALVEGDHAGARALARAPLLPSPAARAWAADLALRAGDAPAALAELAALLADPPPADLLASLLRRDPALYAPALWSAAPREFFAVFARAWATAVAQHIDEPAVQRALLDALGRADLAALPDEPAVTLLTWRALAQRRMQRPGAARRDLEDALARAAPGPRRRDLLIELAALAAADGDADAARRLAAQAVAASDSPTAARDMLRARDELAAVLAQP